MTQDGGHSGDEAYRAELSALVRKYLAGRPEAWALALTMLPAFEGTVPELVSSAGLAAG
ncbi:hypothetical protein ACNAW0_18995 [Micromonospora sp. SL1-18]|uniref:hypothetical protein n=1 Tax=Micromonospora sp. SL1-18 TaxID=3399128 RepID=UPI003A4E2367